MEEKLKQIRYEGDGNCQTVNGLNADLKHLRYLLDEKNHEIEMLRREIESMRSNQTRNFEIKETKRSESCDKLIEYLKNQNRDLEKELIIYREKDWD